MTSKSKPRNRSDFPQMHTQHVRMSEHIVMMLRETMSRKSASRNQLSSASHPPQLPSFLGGEVNKSWQNVSVFVVRRAHSRYLFSSTWKDEKFAQSFVDAARKRRRKAKQERLRLWYNREVKLLHVASAAPLWAIRQNSFHVASRYIIFVYDSR